ncbi:thioredoxin-disulfide reductase [Helcococcus kunzii]|uniref:Thioredoxin reductase n=1 Tax=Helcococcus kunzii ATCC 51366 TaxID=883114 RepID=H3NMX3_9FIRM|nr:thioredoxin-disulfide reductase [Helcococcus kunzii]EHR34714.1 thioredoxin-disulfide reductase [Helcococcus kunzii ATCC 51366]QUY64623.1 thioredoxin-disulfide reductase [Helcococcus kunzii]QZO77038.1 thioredoxin-disulfide reductase [Helcococcus kunzii]
MVYDVIILGAGPAGLTAGLYAARAGLKTAIIEKGQTGGQISLTLEVDNYPGLTGKTGPEMTETMLEQAKSFGAEKINDEIIEVDLSEKIKVLKSRDNTYETKTLIYATGANPRKLNIPGEKEYTGKGVAYCATCDGAFYTGSDIYVVGGGDAAVEEAIFLTKFGKKVVILYRGGELKAAKSIQDKAFANDKIDVKYFEEVREVKGEQFVKELVVEDTKNGVMKTYATQPGDPDTGLFIFAGYIPNTTLLEGKVELERGYVKAGEDTKTSVPGVFAAGDVRTKSVRQVVTATADGAVAAIAAEKYIESL